MFKKDASARDAFTFSLGGLTTINSFVVAKAIADDRFTLNRDRRVNLDQPNTEWKQCLSFGRNRMAVQFNCA